MKEILFESLLTPSDNICASIVFRFEAQSLQRLFVCFIHCQNIFFLFIFKIFRINFHQKDVGSSTSDMTCLKFRFKVWKTAGLVQCLCLVPSNRTRRIEKTTFQKLPINYTKITLKTTQKSLKKPSKLLTNYSKSWFKTALTVLSPM
jgi:hypothetical protein